MTINNEFKSTSYGILTYYGGKIYLFYGHYRYFEV